MDFQKEEEHDHIGYLFDQSAKEKYLKHYPNSELKCSVLEKNDRLKDMLDHLSNVFHPASQLLNSSVNRLCIADINNMILSILSGNDYSPPKTLGFVICSQCFSKATLMLEEAVQVMKDVKDHIDVK